MQNDAHLLLEKSLEALQTNDMLSAQESLKKALLFAPEEPSLHNNLATLYKKSGRFEEAEQHYQKAIELDPLYPEAHHNLANLYAHLKRFDEALRHYTHALHKAPDYMLAHYHLGLLFLAYQKKEEAQIQFKNVIALNPEFKQAHFYLGILALDFNEKAAAKNAFEQVLNYDPHHTEAHVNLGVIALQSEEGQQAIQHFTEALLYDEAHIEARHNLAATFMHHDRYENALTHYTILLEKDPENIEYLYNSGVAEMALGQLQKAEQHFKKVLKITPNHTHALINLAALYSRDHRTTEAKYLLERAHHENPNDTTCKHMLNALNGEKTALTCPEYAKNLFNNYALYYEAHLQETLNYRLPQTIAQLVHQLIPTYTRKHTLDLGCGTGLSGTHLREISQQLTGVDISEKMLREARKKNVYDTLIESELIEFLTKTQTTYDLIVSADVLPYFGDLATLFQEIKAHLLPGGYFIFTIEISTVAPYQLQQTARFAHHNTYIHTLAKKVELDVVTEKTCISRQQAHENLPVLLFALKKQDCA